VIHCQLHEDCRRHPEIGRACAERTYDPRLLRAVWEGDLDKLNELAGCRCCCHEHNDGRGCPAYAWGGCRGQGHADDPEEWCDFYIRTRGFTREQFFVVR
jgi:hypothetical protein